jgi:phage tail-like protein
MLYPTRHQLLRDRRNWLGSLSGLAIDRDGGLILARVPAPSDSRPLTIVTSYPYVRQVSGLALGPCNAVFVSDTEHDRVLFSDGLCHASAWLQGPGQFHGPRGLAVEPDGLLVADSGKSRVQGFAFPLLEANIAWAGWGQPTSIAVDSRQRLLVIDADTATLHRMLSNGSVDASFDANIAAQGKLLKPLFVAWDDGHVWVSDSAANTVFVFLDDGTFASELVGQTGWLPGALAVHDGRIYVADAATGAVLVFENYGSVGSHIGEVNGWRGPVTALAIGPAGDLFIKPGLDATYYRFPGNAAFTAEGGLTAGPFDAGEEREWERAWVDADLPQGTSISVDAALKSTAAPPSAAEWITLPCLDALLALQIASNRRFLWWRLRMATGSPQQSPRLQQARAATAAEELIDYLPLTYRRKDKDANGFLARWLRMIHGEFGRIEELLDDMPRLMDVQHVPASSLAWLAQCLAFELPQIADDDERRALLGRAVRLYARRGSKESIAEFVEIYTGIRPAIVEAFTDRRIWMLGVTSHLGFDTRLPAIDPLGMVVPDEDAGDGCCPEPIAAEPGCLPCSKSALVDTPDYPPVRTAIGRAIVGESGPLASYQIGLPLFSDAAYRFCVVVDGYRAHDPETLAEIARIVDREKPAHTDYRIEIVAPETRVGLQARIGIDAIVGGDPPPLRLGATQLGVNTQLPPPDVARVGSATLDGMLTLT